MQMIKEIKASIKVVLFLITVIVVLFLITIRYGVSKFIHNKLILYWINRPFIKNKCFVI